MSALLSQEQKIVHFLNRTSFGPTAGNIQRAARIGIRAYLDEQLAPGQIADNLADEKIAGQQPLPFRRPRLYGDRHARYQEHSRWLAQSLPVRESEVGVAFSRRCRHRAITAHVSRPRTGADPVIDRRVSLPQRRPRQCFQESLRQHPGQRASLRRRKSLRRHGRT